jgi:hypothetical protein
MFFQISCSYAIDCICAAAMLETTLYAYAFILSAVYCMGYPVMGEQCAHTSANALVKVGKLTM